MQRRAAVQSPAAGHCLAQPQAVARLAGPAVAAGAARRPANDDGVVFRVLADAVTNRDHGAGAFVTEDAGQRERQVAVAGQAVGVADAGRGQPYQHLAGAGIVEFEGLQGERSVEFLDDRGRNTHVRRDSSQPRREPSPTACR